MDPSTAVDALLTGTPATDHESLLRALAAELDRRLACYAATEDRLRQIASTVRHSGDYAKLWWNPVTKTVWWNGADSDFDPEAGHTSWPELAAQFTAIAGVEVVQLATEADPVDWFDNDTWLSDWIELDYQPDTETQAWFAADDQRFIAQMHHSAQTNQRLDN
jgi:hypothetical protein